MSRPAKINKAKIHALKAQGWSNQAIADEVGCSKHYVAIVVESPEHREARMRYLVNYNRQRRLLKKLEQEASGRINSRLAQKLAKEQQLDPGFGEKVRQVLK